MKEHAVSNRISRDIVNLLIARGMTPGEIAGTLDVTKSFISRVKSGARNFTLNHLSLLEEAVGQSLPLLLIEAIPTDTFSQKQKRVINSCRHLLKTMGSGRQGTQSESKKPAARTRAA